MTKDLIVRLAVVAVVAALVVGARPLLRAWRAARARRVLADGHAAEFRTGAPVVLLFTGALCGDCIRQKDVLERLDPPASGVAVREIFAAAAPSLARRFGVRGVPATVILDGDGRPAAVNYGLVDADTLGKQLEAAFA